MYDMCLKENAKMFFDDEEKEEVGNQKEHEEELDE